MEATYRFYKTSERRWFIDIPEWDVDNIAALEMVAGADRMLDVVSGNTNEVWLELSDESGTHEIIKIKDGEDIAFSMYGEGCIYQLRDYKGEYLQQHMWLCDVTKYVFQGEFPRIIYFDVI